MADYDYDLVVIGGGSGGVRAARWSAMTGARVAIVEEHRYGGTCVIRGCVPKKLMVFASGFTDAVEDARGFGWTVEDGTFDWPWFIAKKDREIDRLEEVYVSNLRKTGVNVFRARASVAGPHEVALSTGERFSCAHILIATGGTPFKPEVPGIELAITSNDIFWLDRQPRRMLIVGGGYISCEFACIMNGLGTKVTQFYRGAQILRGFDDEVRGHIAEEIRKRGVDLHVGRDVTKMLKCDDGIEVHCTDGSVNVFDTVLYATGRSPNTAGMGLEDVGVELGRGGEVKVDGYSQTSVPSIFAIGDVTDRIALTPVAIHEGMCFADTVFRGEPRPADHSLVPSAVFTQPEIGCVGLTQEEARETHDIEVYRTTFRPMFHAFVQRDQRMLIKVIVDRADRKVLGVHIVGPQAAEMIQMVAIAVKMGATKEDFDRTIPVHPTAAEEIVTLRDAMPG